jgi:hypothetical protein
MTGISGFQRIFAISCLLLIFTSTGGLNRPVFSSAVGKQPNPTLDRLPFELNYAITFVNYNAEVLNLVKLESSLPQDYGPFIHYNINYEFNLASTSYESKVNSYVDSIAPPDWTSKINETALEAQKSDFQPTDVFETQAGTAIDARKLEDFIDKNQYDNSLSSWNQFQIYVFNFSNFDSSTERHWFNVSEIDPDSNRQRFNWRLEWDYPLNFDVKFPWAAFSEQSNLVLIDPTAFQWYLHWRSIWNSDVEVDDSYQHNMGLLIQNKSLAVQKQIVTDTVSIWLNDWLSNVFMMTTFPVPLGVSVDVQLGVVFDPNEESQEKLEWIINEDFVSDEIKYISNSKSISVNVNYLSLENDTNLRNFLTTAEVDYFTLQNKVSPFQNWKYYDGNYVWGEVFSDTSDLAIYYNPSDSDILVKGMIFLLDNASYAGHHPWIPWSGGLYTGLGGEQVITILYELDRAFMPDRITPKFGLSKVLVHEIGHAIGLPHTFTNRFTSDFVSDVMGYYPGTANFSKLVVNAYWRNAVDNQIGWLRELYASVYTEFGNNASDILLEIESRYHNAWVAHGEKEYLISYNIIQEIILTLETYEGPGSSSTPISSSNNETKRSEIYFIDIPISLMVVTSIITFLVVKRKRKKES